MTVFKSFTQMAVAVIFAVAADGPGLWIVNGTVAIHEVLRVTAQSDNAGDDGKSIDYDYMLEAM